MAATRLRTCLVVGCAANMWDDVEAVREIGEFDATYCVKLAGVHWPSRFHVWCTLHPEFMDAYEDERHKAGLPNGYEIVAPLPGEVGMHGTKGNIARRVSYRWPGMNSSASSGIYAAKVALDDGFDRVVLAGIPMLPDGGHFTRGKPWLQRDSFMPGLKLATPHLVGKVKSMSGHTKDLLGYPTAEWLAGETDGKSQ